MPKPSKEKWIEINEQFKEGQSFHNYTEVTDGTHIRMHCPPNVASVY
jgi:hypothetical protein